MNGGTIGGRMASRLEGDRDQYVPAGPDNEYMGTCHAHGIKRKMSAHLLDAIGEAEFERRTWNGWSKTVCATCHTALTAKGGCSCNPDGDKDHETARLLAMLGLAAPTVEAPRPVRVLRAMHGPLTLWDHEIAEAKAMAKDRGITPAEAAKVRGNLEVARYLERQEEAAKEAELAEARAKYDAKMRARGIL